MPVAREAVSGRGCAPDVMVGASSPRVPTATGVVHPNAGGARCATNHGHSCGSSGAHDRECGRGGPGGPARRPVPVQRVTWCGGGALLRPGSGSRSCRRDPSGTVGRSTPADGRGPGAGLRSRAGPSVRCPADAVPAVRRAPRCAAGIALPAVPCHGRARPTGRGGPSAPDAGPSLASAAARGGTPSDRPAGAAGVDRSGRSSPRTRRAPTTTVGRCWSAILRQAGRPPERPARAAAPGRPRQAARPGASGVRVSGAGRGRRAPLRGRADHTVARSRRDGPGPR